MKEQFVRAEMEIIEFEVEDVITTSGNKGSDDDDLIEFPFIPLN